MFPARIVATPMPRSPEVTVAPSVDHELTRGLAGAVGFPAAKTVALNVRSIAVVVGIDLVGGNDQRRLDAVAFPQGLQQMRGPQHIGGKGFHRLGMGGAH